jgi:transcriptional regulatory protein GAL4
VDEPTLYSSLIAQAKFHLAANKILKRLLSSTNLSAREALALNDLMTPWTAALPWYFQLDQAPKSSSGWYLFARSNLWWKFWNLQITLTRPFLIQWVSRSIESRHTFDGDREEKECRSLCISSAHQTITSMVEYIRQNPLTSVTSWYTLCVSLALALQYLRGFPSHRTDSYADTSCFTPL